METIKRSILCILCLLLVLQLPAVCAADAEGKTGEFTWSLSGGVLTISGEGAMEDYPDGAPWDAYKDQITKVVLTGGVTYLGAYSFKDYDAIQDVDFGDAIYELGKQAFYACDGLTVLHLPQSFKVFGEESLRHCSNLKEIHSEGRFPSFRLNCLWDTKVKIYYPAARPWGLQYIEQMESVYKVRIEFLCSDGTDPYDPNAVTTPPTTEPVVTEPPATEVPTTQATVPAPTLPPPTLPKPTVPPTTQPTLPDITEPVQPPKQEDTGIPEEAWIWLVVAVVFGVLAIAIPSFARPKRRKKRRRRYYDYE